MAREITILEVSPMDVAGDQLVRYAMWFYPAAANQVPKAGFVSAWRQASAADSANLQAGVIVEEARSTTFSNNMSILQFKAYLQNVYNSRASAIAAQPNPNSYYGQFFDGTVWSF